MQALRIAFLALVLSLPSFAQQVGTAENLAPYVPTPQVIVERMLEAGHVKPGDLVYDLGSGDGRIVITAARKFGAHAVGVEIRSDLCRIAVERIKALG
ncbi:MAG: class I SAM-dependent methyltransferase, partial [Acidobacteriia bacterium]|nr:class I SAM-dependent methyltransferase [Terriglobia bacterium]